MTSNEMYSISRQRDRPGQIKGAMNLQRCVCQGLQRENYCVALVINESYQEIIRISATKVFEVLDLFQYGMRETLLLSPFWTEIKLFPNHQRQKDIGDRSFDVGDRHLAYSIEKLSEKSTHLVSVTLCSNPFSCKHPSPTFLLSTQVLVNHRKVFTLVLFIPFYRRIDRSSHRSQPRLNAKLLRSMHGQFQILVHQRRAKTTCVSFACGSIGKDSRDGVVDF